MAPEVAHEALSATIPNYGYRPADVPATDTETDEDDEEAEETADPAEVARLMLRGLGRLPAADRREVARWVREGVPPDAVVTAAAPSEPPC